MCQVKTKYYYMNNITKANVISQPQSKASVCVCGCQTLTNVTDYETS